MTEKHDVFKNADAAQATAAELMQLPDNQHKITFTQVDRFIVNDCTSGTGNAKSICDLRDGPYYIVSVVA